MTPDVIVVGGGLIGCLAARSLADDGRRVILFERDAELGQRASTAAAGMLSPQMEWAEDMLVGCGESEGGRGETARRPDAAERIEAMLALCVAARDRWSGFVADLEAETGLFLHYRDEGTLVVALSDTEAGDLAERAGAQRLRGLRAEWLDARAALDREPGLAREARGALFLPDDRQVDPGPLMAAAAAALDARPGIRVETGTAVTSIESAGGRVAGVRTAGGANARVEAELVLLAAGAWSAGIAGLPRPLAVRPVKGQMAALRPAPMPIRHVVGGRAVYCVPRDDGRVVVGATVEEAGFDESVEAPAIEALVAAVSATVPALAAAPVESRWAGLRPGTSDDLPILGEDPDLPGLLYATGHYRNGILLAPLTAELVAALVGAEATPVDLTPFSPSRPSLASPMARG